jgi:16S rRNA C967 or C1407 C5-methylase (RsmB/RsmF family)
VVLHVLPAGARFDLTARALVPQPPTIDPEDAAELAEEQAQLLPALAPRVRPGGRLVYSVCTLSPGEERLAGASRRHLWPQEDDSDGFYIAVDG